MIFYFVAVFYKLKVFSWVFKSQLNELFTN